LKEHLTVWLLFSLWFALGLVCNPLSALEVLIGQGIYRPIPTALFFYGDGTLVKDVKRTIYQNLHRSGVALLNPQKRMPENMALVNGDPDFAQWRMQGLQFLATLKLKKESGKITVQLTMWDLLQGSRILSITFMAGPKALRILAHKISNALYRGLTKTEGYFDTEIIYVGGHGTGKGKRFSLGKMHLDGAHHKYLATFKSLLKSPVLTPTSDRVFYIRNPKIHKNQIFTYNFKTQKEQTISVPGNVLSFNLVPGNAENLIISLIRGQDILTGYFSLLKQNFQPLLPPYKGVQTSASLNPKTGDIIFNSNQLGRPRLFILPKNGSPYPLSVSAGSCYTPSWSPKGERLAFIRRDGRGFNLSILRPYTGGEKTVATFYWLDCPFWTNSGSAIIFTGMRHARDPMQLYLVDLNSLKIQKLKTPDEAFEPCASQLLRISPMKEF
jgi:TolB protein